MRLKSISEAKCALSASGRPGSRVSEADARRIGDSFHRLPEDVPVWRTWAVIERLPGRLGLSPAAAGYAGALLRLLREADWRGDGRPVTYASVKSRARRMGCDERTIHRWELALIRAGLCYRTCRHARRHGGGGDGEAASGLDWSPLGARIEELIAACGQADAYDREWDRARAALGRERDRIIQLLATAAIPGVEELAAAFAEVPCQKISVSLPLDELARRLARLTLIRTEIEARLPVEDDVDQAGVDQGDLDAIEAAQNAVRNSESSPPMSDWSDIDVGHIDTTTDSNPCFCNETTPPNGGEAMGFAERAHARICLEKKDAAASRPRNPKISPEPEISPRDLLRIAPDRWREAVEGVAPDWQVVSFVAAARRAELGVSEHAWTAAVRGMGPRKAAICLAILDANRDHPTHPVRSVGGAFVAMTRRDAIGDLDLAPSLRWIAARRAMTADAATVGSA